MLLGIGIDILSIPRLQGLISRRGAVRVAQRICSSSELADFHALRASDLEAKQLRFLCARWATKEAAFKALPPRTLSGWKDLALSYAASGRPALQLVWEARDANRRKRAAAAAAAAGAATARAAGTEAARGSPSRSRSGAGEGAEFAGAINTTDIRTTADAEADPVRASLLPTLSHDAGVLVAVVVAQEP